MGPTLAILLRTDADTPSSQELLAVAHTLDPSARTPIEISVRSTASIRGGVDVREGRPFGFNIGQVGLEKEELNAVEQAFGFVPTAAINVFAYANAPVDHRILAELGIFFVRGYGGIVDFGGNLGAVNGRSGIVVEIPYVVDATPATFHVSDAAFLEAWLTDASFHMIK
jgi:hypothetical protein